MPDTTPASPEESGPHDHHGEDWLQTPEVASAAPPAAPSPYAPPPGYPAKRRWAWLHGGVWRSRPVYAVVGLIIGAGVVLGGVALADDHGQAGRAAAGNSGNRTDNGRNGGFNGRDDRGRGNESDNGSGQAAGSQERIEGTVSAASATSITVRTANGSLTYALTANTPVTGAVTSVAGLRVGESVVVYVTSSTNNVAATIDRVIAG